MKLIRWIIDSLSKMNCDHDFEIVHEDDAKQLNYCGKCDTYRRYGR